MNGDGFPDIVTSGFTILFGDGRGGFPKRADYWQEVTGNIILADFDGDGEPDIIVGTGTAGALTGALWPYSEAAIARSAARQVSLVSGLPSNNPYNYSQVAADFDGEGNPDLVVQIADRLTVLKGIGDGTFRQAFQYIPASGYPTHIAAADLNHDGKPDIVVTIANNNTARTEVLLGNGDGTFQAPLPVTSSCCVTAFVVADFNGDGKPDVAVLLHNPSPGISPDQLLVYLGTGAGPSPHPWLPSPARTPVRSR